MAETVYYLTAGLPGNDSGSIDTGECIFRITAGLPPDDSESGEGWTWGEQNPDPETAVEWSVWKVKESANDARDTGDWGVLQLGSGEEFVSDVKDRGNTDVQHLSLSYDDYAVGSGSGTLYWRGQATTFNYNDDEIAGPTWEVYSPGNKSWRFIQLMCEG